MIFTNIKRIVRSGIIGFWRNGFISLSAVLVMSVTLFVIGSTIFLSALLQSSLLELRDKVDINVYFSVTAPESEVLAMKERLGKLPEVLTIEYISREKALAVFKERHKDDQLALQALDELGENPLGAALNVKAKDPAQYEGIAKFLEEGTALGTGEVKIVDSVNYNKNKDAIERLIGIIDSAKRIGIAVNIVLAAVSVLIAFNTIRLTIYVSREEISVMRLVGAGNTYIRGPFVVSGILYGIVAGLITLALFYPATNWLGGATANFFSGINIVDYYFANFTQFFGIIIGSGVFLGGISSYLSVKRYLRT